MEEVVQVEKKKSLKKSLFKIFLGNMLMAFAYSEWMVPNEIINGGATSLAMLIKAVTGIPLLWATNGLEVFLLICCGIFLGKETMFKSLYTSITYVICFNVFYSLPLDLSFNIVIDLILASIFIAFGYYANLSEKSSTVSVDVFALIIFKYYKKIPLAKLLRYMNWLVLLFGFFIYGPQSVVVGIALSFIYTFILNQMMELNEKGKMFI